MISRKLDTYEVWGKKVSKDDLPLLRGFVLTQDGYLDKMYI